MGDFAELLSQLRRIVIPTIAFMAMLVMVIFSFDPQQVVSDPNILSLFRFAVMLGSISGVISVFTMLFKCDWIAAKDVPIAALIAAVSVLMTDGNNEDFTSERELYAFLIMAVLWFGLIRLMKESLE